MDVQIKRDAKILVASVFAVRLLDIVFSGFNLARIHSASHNKDLGLAIVPSIIWTQAELLWSIVAASVPCLKTFMRPFDKIDEDTWRSNNDMHASQRSHRSWLDPKDGSVPLEEVKGHKRGMVVTKTGKSLGKESNVRPDKVGHDVVIAHTGLDDSSEEEHRRSWGSQERIIKAQTHWEVRHESGPRDPYAIP